jgi:peroxiredoxin family protein
MTEEVASKRKSICIIAYSGELEPTWASMIIASTAAAMDMEVSIFVTFWGFGALVKDSKNLMQRMLSVMQRPGISHRKLSKMNFMGMGPWMMFQLAKKYNVSKPKDLLGMCQELGVKIYPCQMTMDLFGLNKADLIDGLEDPVGAATMLQLATDADSTLFI